MALNLNNINQITGKALANVYKEVDPAGGNPNGGQNRAVNLTAQTLNIVKNFDFGPTLSVLKDAGIVASVIFGCLFIWIVLKMRNKMLKKITEVKLELNPPAAGKSKHDAKWQEVQNHIRSLQEAEWKFAVIEADKIVEEVLREAGWPGDTLGEKLMQIDKNQLVSIDELWEAHKLRNVIVHDPDRQVRLNDARVAVSQYEKALRELGALG